MLYYKKQFLDAACVRRAMQSSAPALAVASVLFANSTVLAFSWNATMDSQDATKKQESKDSDFDKEWKKLMAEHGAAQTEYYKPYENVKTPEEAAKIKLDPEKDPEPIFAPKVKDLAVRARGTNAGLEATNWLLQQSARFGGTAPAWVTEGVQFAVDEVLKHYIQHKNVGRAVSMMVYAARIVDKKIISDAFVRIEKEATNKETKAEAAFAAANLSKPGYGETPDPEKAKARAAALNRLIKQYGDTSAAKRAEAEIFEAENLAIGKAAPEVLGADQDGKEFKLSEYKGKVVVLDFWGFW